MSAKQILVVEDERPIREMIAFGLRRAGFEVREAGDARTGRAEVANKLPDLLLVDGGKGQLSAVMSAFQAVAIDPPFTLSLAKREEEVFLPGESEPRRLSRHSFALRLLQYVRDEAHRFAQAYHHTLRRKSTFE